MAYMMNSVNVIGRLTDDVKIEMSSKGKSYCKFTLAVQRDKENTDFIDCVVFDKVAENIEKYNGEKGMMLGVTGQLETSSYDDSDGIRRKSATVVVRDITFVGRSLNGKETE